MLRHHRNDTRSKSPTTLRVSPLDIPEILERILLCLPRRTLKRVARVVCRQWFLLSRRHIPQRLHSSENYSTRQQRYDDIHSLLQTATTVHWTISTEDFCEGRLMTEQLLKKYSTKDRLNAIMGRNDEDSTSVRVLDLTIDASSYYADISVRQMEPRLLEVLKDRCDELQTFSFSHTAQQCCRPQFIQKLIDQVAPNATEWGLDARPMNPTTFGRLLHRSSTVRNVVTRLDLTLSNPSERFFPNATGLFTYLRASPYLLHLIAPDVTLAADDIDPFHGLPTFPHGKIAPHNLIPRSSPMAAWACRNLQTLKMALLEKYTNADDIFERSRIVFGFLSRACPKLQELDVSLRSPSLSFESGFCDGIRWEENGALTDVWNVLHQLAGADQKAEAVWPLLSQLSIFLNLRSRKAMSDLVHKYRPWVDTSNSVWMNR
ncbi:hypothetical protein BG003_003371 [Podila horticola]|nr:hypothetical protein BG003_003371 [Podila horticola]